MTGPPGVKRPRPKGASRGGRVGPALVALLCALVIGAPYVVAAVGRPAGAVYISTGYNTLIDGLIAKLGWLQVDYSNPDKPRVTLSALAPQSDAVRRFQRSSYLGQDEQHADENVWRFDRDGQRVIGVNPDAHRLARPFTDEAEWTGDLQFRDGGRPAPTLRNASGTLLTFTAPPIHLDPKDAHATPVDLKWRGPHELGGPRFDLTLGNETVANLFMVGDRVFLRFYPGHRVGMQVDGHALSAADGAAPLAALENHGAVVLTGGGVSTVFGFENGRSAVSHYEAGRPRSRYTGLESLAKGVETAMGRSAANVATTLDRDLQTTVQATLYRKAEELRDGGQAFPASATLMDASTGEILALASYPSSKAQLDTSAARSVHADPMLQRNQAFVRMPVGSIAKVPFSLAILKSDPSLVGLKTLPAQVSGQKNGKDVRSFRTLLGVDLGAEIEDHVLPQSGTMLDFQTFLGHSSNKYAAALMLLAMGPNTHPVSTAPSEAYQIGATAYHNAPDLSFLQGSPDLGQGLKPRLRHTPSLPWTLELKSLFDLNVDNDLTGRSGAYDTRIWGPSLGGAAWAAVSPEREAFGLGSIHNLASDYIMTILGGGRSRWTTVKVAEVFSRIVTRQPVAARMALETSAEARARAKQPAPARLDVDDASWRAVIDGMRHVVMPGGTGASLAEAFPPAPPATIRVFAKTGTPTLERFTGRKPANQALQGFIDRGCELGWDAAKAQIRTPEGLDRSPCVDAGGAPLIVGEIARLNRSFAGRPPAHGLALAGGRVIGVPFDPASEALAGHALALVIARYANAAAPDDRPVRALTLAINIQKRPDTDKLPAVEVARALLHDPALRTWLMSDPTSGVHP